jgi:hypothetical protein
VKITRRKFLIGIGIAGAGTVAAGSGAFWFFRDHPFGMFVEKVQKKLSGYRYPHADLASAITKHYHYLTLDADGVDRFAQLYTKNFGAKTWKTSLEDAFERFLLSTDFFQNGADESKHVRFIMMYDPHRTVCFNPLAVLDEAA